jgi:hypothetical protein
VICLQSITGADLLTIGRAGKWLSHGECDDSTDDDGDGDAIA